MFEVYFSQVTRDLIHFVNASNSQVLREMGCIAPGLMPLDLLSNNSLTWLLV